MTAAVTVAIVAKRPRAGFVKTRLSPALTPEQAARLALSALRDTMDTVASLHVARRVLFCDGEAPNGAREAGFDILPQQPGTLDERLAHLLDAVLGPLLILGMDTPQLTAADLEAVCVWNDPVDAWLGLADDGGFWALAVSEPDGALVRGIPMSRPDTGARQLRRLQDAGLRVGRLPVLRDFDVVEDLDPVAALAPGTRFARDWADISAELVRS